MEFAQQLHEADPDARDLRFYIARNTSVRQGIATLWGLGFWTDQIALFIGRPIDEATVLQALRGYLMQKQREIMLSYLAFDLNS